MPHTRWTHPPPTIPSPYGAASRHAGPSATVLQRDGREFVRPATLAAALRRLREDPDATVVAGCTDWGVEVNLRGARASTGGRGTTGWPDCVNCGSTRMRSRSVPRLTLTEIERRLAGRVPLLAEVFPQFASRLIRNGATLGGNHRDRLAHR